jgi:site-specific DNA recombinase
MSHKPSVILAEVHRDQTQLAPKAPIVAYVRVSSDEQARRKTIDAQRIEVEAWAKARGLKIARTVADDGHSGTTISGRPGFSKLLTEVRTGKVGTLVVVAPDRLTRAEDWSDRAAIMGALKAHRTLLVLTGYGDFDPTAETADMMLSNFFVLASMERKRMRSRLFAGRMRAAENGRPQSGHVPFARRFDKPTGKWLLVEEKAEIYRRLYRMCLDGVTGRATAVQLNAEGVPSPGGKRWSAETVTTLLKAESAIGVFRSLGREIQIPPVVDPDTRRKAMALVESRRKSNGRPARSPRLLAGLMTCATCGATMHQRQAPGRPPYYICATGHPGWVNRHPNAERPACAHKWHAAEPLEALVWSETVKLLSDPAQLAAAAGIGSKSKAPDAAKAIAAAEKELAGVDREAQNLMRLYRRGLASEKDLERQLAEVQRSKTAAEQALSNAKAARAARDNAKSVGADLAARVKVLTAGIEKATPAQKRALIAALFPKAEGCALKVFMDGRIQAVAVLPALSTVSNDLTNLPVDSKAGDDRAVPRLTFRLDIRPGKRRAS